MSLDPRIGMLSNGKYYAFVHGYDKPEITGTLEQIENALGVRRAPASRSRKNLKSTLWQVHLTFQYPAWDQVDGFRYEGIVATSKSEANRKARQLALNDGHLVGGSGRVTFIASAIDPQRCW